MAASISIAILANASQAKKELDGVAGKVEGLSSTFSKFRLPAVVALGAITVGATKAINSASDLNETVSKTQTIFGKSADGIIAWGDQAATSLGMSKQAALDGVSTFGNFFDQIGIGAGQSAEMSKSFVQMATDLGSFHNAAPTDVMDALAAATRGEYDSLQKFIPTINAAAVEQEALAATGKKSAKELTDADKAAALYTLSTEGMGAAAGDFARTQDSAANSQKILAAQTADLSAQLGTALLPAYQAVLKIVRNVVGVMAKHQTQVKIAVVVIGALAVFVLAASSAMKVYNAVMSTGKAITAGVTAVTKAYGIVTKLNTTLLGTWLGVKRLEAVAWVKSAAATVAATAANVAAKAVLIAGAIATGVATAAQWALNAAMTANPIGLIIAGILLLIAGLVLFFTKTEIGRKIWAGFVAFLQAAWKAIVTFVTAYIKAVLTVITTVFKAIKAVALVVWGAIVTAVTTYVKAVKTVITTVFNTVKDFVVTVWGNIKNAIVTAVTTIKTKVAEVKDKILGVFSGAANWLKDIGGKIIQGLIDGIMSGFKKVKDTLAKLTDMLPDWKGPAAKDKTLLVESGQLIMGGLVTGLEDGTKDVQRHLQSVTTMIGDAMGQKIDVTLGASALDTFSASSAAQTKVTVILTAEQVSALQRGREVQADLDVYRAAGGRVRAA